MKKKNGFTLIELLAVIVILAILVVIATPNVMKTINNSRENTFKVEAKEIFKAAKKQYIEYMNTGSNTTLTFRSDYSDTEVKPGECNSSSHCKLDIDNSDDITYNITLLSSENDVQYDQESKVCNKKYNYKLMPYSTTSGVEGFSKGVEC